MSLLKINFENVKGDMFSLLLLYKLFIVIVLYISSHWITFTSECISTFNISRLVPRYQVLLVMFFVRTRNGARHISNNSFSITLGILIGGIWLAPTECHFHQLLHIVCKRNEIVTYTETKLSVNASSFYFSPLYLLFYHVITNYQNIGSYRWHRR